MMTRGVRIIALLLLLVISSARAENDAGYESPFSAGVGARAMSLGSGFTAVANDASLLYYNPGGLALLGKQEVSFMHAPLFEGTNYNFAGWVVPIGDRSGTGIGFMRIGTDDIIGRDNFMPTDTTSFSHTQIVFSYARLLTDRLSLGGSIKVVNQSLGGFSDYAYGGDLGAILRLRNKISIGLVARDLIAPDLELDSTREQSPRSYVIGAALTDLSLSDQLALSITGDLEKINERDVRFHGGAEALFGDHFAIRAGMDDATLSLGAGFRVGQMKIDYAYKSVDVLDDTHRFSIAWLLGTPRRAEPIIIDRVIEPEPLTKEQQRARDIKETAHSYFRNSELDSALFYYNLSLEFDPTDEETTRMISAIESTLDAENTQVRVDTLIDEQQFLDRYYSQANQFYNKKLYGAATDLLDIILELNPGYVLAEELRKEIETARRTEVASRLLAADSARSNGRVVDEINAYNRILEIDPNNQPVIDARSEAMAGLDQTQQLNLGIRLFQQGQYNSALRRFRAVLDSSPGDLVAKEYIEKIESALAGPSSLEELQQNREIWALYLQGIRDMRNAEYQRAIDAWEKILEVFPNNVNTLNNLEQARLRLKSENGN